MRILTGPAFLACLSLASSAAAEPRVAVGEVDGPTGAQIGYAVAQAIDSKVDLISNSQFEAAAGSLGVSPSDAEAIAPIGAKLGAQAVVAGEVTRDGNQWKCTLKVHEVATREVTKDWSFTSSSLRNLSKIAGRQVWLQLGAALRAAESAAPAATPGPAAVEPAGPKRIAVLTFEGGERAAKVRRVVVQSLASGEGIEFVPRKDATDTAAELGVTLSAPVGRIAVAEVLNVDAFVSGRIFRRSGYYYGAIYTHQGRDGELVETLKLKRKGYVSLGRALASRLRAPIQAALGPLPPKPLPEAEPVPEPEVEREEADEEDKDAEKKDKPKKMRSQSPLEIGLGFQPFFRQFDYNDPLTPLRPYEANFAAALVLVARWYPGAHFVERGALRHIGIDLEGDFSIGLTSSDEDGNEFNTRSFSFLGGLRGRLPLGPSELGAVVSFGTDSFIIDEDDAGNDPGTPSVSYTLARFGADGRIQLIPALDFAFAGGYRAVFDAGDITSDQWFPQGDVGGFDATAKLNFNLLKPVFFELGVNYVHYFFSFNVTPEDAAAGQPIAGGALDQYTQIFLRVLYVL